MAIGSNAVSDTAAVDGLETSLVGGFVCNAVGCDQEEVVKDPLQREATVDLTVKGAHNFAGA